MSESNGAARPSGRLDALLANLARAGWYSAPVHGGWSIATGSGAIEDRWNASVAHHVGQLANPSAAKMTNDRASRRLHSDSINALPRTSTAPHAKSQNVVKRIAPME
jgi:hypothetical protein